MPPPTPTTSHAHAHAHAMPAAYVRDLLELAARWGVGADALLAGLPLDARALTDPATRVPIAVCAEIVARAQRLTGEPALALHVGTQMRLSSHGFLGFAAMTAGTLGEAIELAVRFASTRTTALGLARYVEGDTVSLVIEEPVALGALRELAVLGLIVGMWQLGEALTGQRLDGRAECAFARPAYLDRVPFAAGRIDFARPASRLLFPTRHLALPLTSADPLAAQLARAACERELAAVVDAGLPGRVRAAVAAQAAGVPAIATVARDLRMSTRTLKRRLAERGTTFTAIVDDVRRQRSLLLLDDRAVSIGEIAARLGYTEPPNFIRAFRRWAGTTPAAYRARRPA